MAGRSVEAGKSDTEVEAATNRKAEKVVKAVDTELLHDVGDNWLEITK